MNVNNNTFSNAQLLNFINGAINGWVNLEQMKFPLDKLKAIREILRKEDDRIDPKPLTLEQLKQMDGKNIYIPETKRWWLVSLNNYLFERDCVIDSTIDWLSLSQAVKRGAYAHKPKEGD